MGDPFVSFENWLMLNYPHLWEQSIEESDTEALYEAIADYHQCGQAERVTGVLPIFEEVG